MASSAERRGGALRAGDEALHALDEQLRVVRLGNKGVRVALEGADHVVRIGQRGQKDDRHVGEVRVTADGPAEFVAVHFRHDDVRDDQLRARFPSDGQGLPSVPCAQDLGPPLLDRPLEQSQADGIVIDDEDFHEGFSSISAVSA